MKPLFPMLLTPLVEREKPFFDGNAHKQENLEFVEGLTLALDRDIANGLIPSTAQAQEWAQYLHPPRSEASQPRLAQVDLPPPGQPWPPQVDPREALLARLVHLGADPWLGIEITGNAFNTGAHGTKHYQARFLGENLASTWLSYGYSNLARMALAMPHQASDYMAKAPMRSFHEGHLTMVQQAAIRDEVAMLDHMLQQGAPADGILMHAQSPQAATLLLQAGATLDQKETIQHWLKNRSGKAARALIQATEAELTPLARFKQALNGKSWGAVSDALEAWKDWQTQTIAIGDASFRLGLYALFSSTRGGRGGEKDARVRHALRILAKQPPTDQEILPGVSEKSFVALCLHTLGNPHPSETNGRGERENQLTDELLDQLAKNPCAGDLPEVAKSLLQASAKLQEVPGLGYLVDGLLRNGIILPRASGPAEFAFSQRTLEDTILAGQVARCLWNGANPRYLSKEAFTRLFGITPDSGFTQFGYGGKNGKDARGMMIPRLMDKHPDRVRDIATAALNLLGAGLSHAFYTSSIDLWAVLCDQIDRLVDLGGLADLSPKDAETFMALAQQRNQSKQAQVLGEQLQANIQQILLNHSTPPSNTPMRPARRF